MSTLYGHGRLAAIIGAPLDFVGINVYIPSQLVMASAQRSGYQDVPFNVSHSKMFSSWHRLAAESQYWCTRFLRSLWKPKEIYITENGCAASSRGQLATARPISRRLSDVAHLAHAPPVPHV